MTTISNKVRLYRYSDANAPVLSGTAGALVTLLDACLVDGYDSKSINTLTVASGVATASISSGHSYDVGAVVRISGATPSALNGDWRVAAADGTSFDFSVEGLGIADGAATGTITALRAPAGWEKVYSDTNRAAYRSLDYASHNGMVLYVDDTGTTTARTRGYESMSDIDTGTGPFPTDAQSSGGLWWGKSNTGDNSFRKWALVADPRRVTFAFAPDGTYLNNVALACFGKLAGHHQSDPSPNMISGASSASVAVEAPYAASHGLFVLESGFFNASTIYLARGIVDANPVAGQASVTFGQHASGASSYPSMPLSAELSSSEATIFEMSTNRARGRFPGPAHNYQRITGATAFDVVGQPGDGALWLLTYYDDRSIFLNLGTAGRFE
jgi:hypothetical protein